MNKINKWIIILNSSIALALVLMLSAILPRYKQSIAFTKIMNIHSFEFIIKIYNFIIFIIYICIEFQLKLINS